MSDATLTGRTIAITADRRWEEQAALFEKRGARVVHAPTLMTVDLRGDERLRAGTADVVASPPDVFVATTGAGMKLWFEVAAEWGLRDDLVGALQQVPHVVARGAKASSAVKGAGIEVHWTAPNESMADVVDHLHALGVSDRRVGVQLFEPDDHPATRRLRSLARDVVEVPLYKWQLPLDTQPARDLVSMAIEGRVDAVTFTSQPAVRHLFAIARDITRADDLRDAFNGGVLAACIGPVCAEALHEEGVTQTVWPQPNRLVAMVRQVEELLSASHARRSAP